MKFARYSSYSGLHDLRAWCKKDLIEKENIQQIEKILKLEKLNKDFI